MIICSECNEVIIGEMVPVDGGQVHFGGCPSLLDNSMDIARFSAKVSLPREAIELSNNQLDAIQRLSVICHSLDQEINPENILTLWPMDTQELVRSGPKPAKSQIEIYIRTTAFLQDMATRGVRLDEMSQQLTSKQYALVTAMRNPTGRKLSTILKRVGVTQTELDAWMKQPLFAKYAAKMIGDSTDQALLFSEVPLSQKALEGDLSAIKFLYEFRNKYNPAKDNNAQDAQEFVQIVLAAVQQVIGRQTNGPELLGEIQQVIEMRSGALGIGKA